jgi:hypothetical protein
VKGSTVEVVRTVDMHGLTPRFHPRDPYPVPCIHHQILYEKTHSKSGQSSSGSASYSSNAVFKVSCQKCYAYLGAGVKFEVWRRKRLETCDGVRWW